MIYKDAGSIPLYRIKDSEEISPFVGDLAEKIGEVSLNKKSLLQIKKYGRLLGGNHSVFNEIEWVNPIKDIEQNIKPVKPEVIQRYSIDYWARLFTNYLLNWFRDNLHEDEEYWVLHSSGFDSRILSGILAKLRDEEGFERNIKFVCWYPEAVQANKILEYLGWSGDNIWLVGAENKEFISKEKYWSRSNYVNFEDAGYLTNGEIHPFGSSQSNFWRPYFEDNEVKKINIISAMIADMVMGAHWWMHWAKRFYLDYRKANYTRNLKWDIIISASARYNGLGLLGYIRDFKELLTPTMDFDFVNIGVNIPFICRYKDNIRIRVLENLKPGLSQIDNLDASWGRFTKEVPKNSKTFYKNSQFYKFYQIDSYSKIKNMMIPDFLSLASLYDYLISKGVHIKGEIL